MLIRDTKLWVCKQPKGSKAKDYQIAQFLEAYGKET
jgi:hypothetical protein